MVITKMSRLYSLSKQTFCNFQLLQNVIANSQIIDCWSDLTAHRRECLIIGIRRSERVNVLQLRGESRQPVFHFLTSSEIELEAEPRYLYARFLYTLSRLALLLAKSHLNEYCIVSNRLNSHYTQHYTATKQSQTRTWNPAIINIYSCLHFPLVMFPNFGFVIA